MGRVYEQVLAASIAAGSPGPFSYYLFITDGNERKAAEILGDHRLAQIMGRPT
jgi:hypothetical protein